MYKKNGNAKEPKERNKTNNTIKFKFNKTLGQHILKNPLVVQGIIDKAEIRQSDTVLEVGPGTGNLSMKILEKAKRLIAVEQDPRMAAEITKRARTVASLSPKLEVMLGDVIKTKLPYFDLCISNTPYQISSPLVFKLLQQNPPPRKCILMFQREFALRLVAKPGDSLYCRLSANVQMFARVKHIMKVSKNNFRPPPMVESSVISLEPKSPRPNINPEEWDGILRICFLRKNKSLHALFTQTSIMQKLRENYITWCSQTETIPEENFKLFIETILNECDCSESRANKLGESDFLKLLVAFNRKGVYFA